MTWHSNPNFKTLKSLVSASPSAVRLLLSGKKTFVKKKLNDQIRSSQVVLRLVGWFGGGSWIDGGSPKKTRA
jgi:hypothetical protein